MNQRLSLIIVISSILALAIIMVGTTMRQPHVNKSSFTISCNKGVCHEAPQP